MSITESNIKLLQSERMHDNADGGGFMTGNVVADGVENNLFPDIAETDRVFGRVQIRKIYPAITSPDADTYMGANIMVDEPAADPAVSALIVTKAGYSQVRSDLVNALDNSGYKVAVGASKRALGSESLTAGVSNVVVMAYYPPSVYSFGSIYTLAGELAPGDLLGLFAASQVDPIPALSVMEVVTVASVAIGAPGGSNSAVTLTAPVQRNYPGTSTFFAVKLTQDTVSGALQFYGQSTTTAALAVNDRVIPVVSSYSQYIPVPAGGSYPTVPASVLGVGAEAYRSTLGRVKVFRANESLVVHHTATVAPQTVTNGQDINLGRTRLAKVRVYNSAGAEITTGFTVDLVTGHIVFNAVAGYAQPVTIKHRIEDMLLIESASETSVTVARGVSHVFPSDSRVSSVLMFGDLQARVHDGFQQTTWSATWADTASGGVPSAAYNEAASPIVVTNAGAISERWAVIFTSATGFRVIGEQVGEVVAAGAGSTATTTAPINPATAAPYFSIPSTGWGTGWATGNVYRFNTDGANAPVWLIRSTAPSDPFVGQDKFSVALRGSVNA
jgi:hypothetical protein